MTILIINVAHLQLWLTFLIISLLGQRRLRVGIAIPTFYLIFDCIGRSDIALVYRLFQSYLPRRVLVRCSAVRVLMDCLEAKVRAVFSELLGLAQKDGSFI